LQAIGVINSHEDECFLKNWPQNCKKIAKNTTQIK
jgi:hypothetical protein